MQHHPLGRRPLPAPPADWQSFSWRRNAWRWPACWLPGGRSTRVLARAEVSLIDDVCQRGRPRCTLCLFGAAEILEILIVFLELLRSSETRRFLLDNMDHSPR